LQDFLSRTLFLHIRSELRRWQTRDKSEELTGTLREVGDSLARVFADEEGSFKGCFAWWNHSFPDESKEDVDARIKKMRVELGLTSGTIKLAELLSEFADGEEEGLTWQEKNAVLCDAKNIFNLVKDELRKGAVGSWEEAAWLRASKFGEAIDASEPQC
jgi:hypothetical protein